MIKVQKVNKSPTLIDEATSVLGADISNGNPKNLKGKNTIRVENCSAARGLTHTACRSELLQKAEIFKKLIRKNNLNRLYLKEQGQKVTLLQRKRGCKKIQDELGRKLERRGNASEHYRGKNQNANDHDTGNIFFD
ncbi:hypothetical protein TNCV_996191 [Trichonephila clavipes]|nr:hypothetical protein TNCV_996191 [Trichonephila clavipes]